jgi:hypothetical protein
LFAGTDEVVPFCSSAVSIYDLQRNWYHAALFFLDKADFLRTPDIQTVQTIAVLGVIFNNVGDIGRHKMLWSIAIRQAQELQLGVDDVHEETNQGQQLRRRLWWTLVLCEWIPAPYRPPCINDFDFNCALPDEVDDEELQANAAPSRLPRSKPRPVRYHIEMIKVAKIYYKLRHSISLRSWTSNEVASFVFAADEELAGLINDLPNYLQPHEPITEQTLRRDADYTWIPEQKRSLSSVLLYYRMATSRLLQDSWPGDPISSARTRAICLSSARGLISTTLSQTVHPSKSRTWYAVATQQILLHTNIARAAAFNIFSASTTLALESANSDEHFADDVQRGLRFLKDVRSENLIAEHAIALLARVIEDAASG